MLMCIQIYTKKYARLTFKTFKIDFLRIFLCTELNQITDNMLHYPARKSNNSKLIIINYAVIYIL